MARMEPEDSGEGWDSEGQCSLMVPRDSLPRGGHHSEGSCSYLPVYFLIFSVSQASDVGKEFLECFQDFATQVGEEALAGKEKKKAESQVLKLEPLP